MPKLNCCVETCAYNEEKHCSLGEINVEGGEPAVPSTTCCNSYIEKGSISNSTGVMLEEINIRCRATECVHNHTGVCAASNVSIVGQDAECSDETHCNTFCKC